MSTAYAPEWGIENTGLPKGGAKRWWYFCRVIDKRIFDDLNERIADALRNTPAADLEKNLRALLASWADRLDLVAREDFDVQRKLVERAQAKLAELEKRLAELEMRAPGPRAK